MKIVFMGTPEFATVSLKAILDAGFEVVAVVTATDKPAGRGLKPIESDVKIFAKENGLTILQPERLKNTDFISELSEFEADVFVVVAFRMLPAEVWQMPELGTINLHASLLPAYRGAAPINHAIINGETESGVSTFFIQKEIDTGNIILQASQKIPDEWNAGNLHDVLAIKGSKLLVDTLLSISKNEINPIPQIHLKKGIEKTAPKISREFCQINWNIPAIEIRNLIRGLSPWPGAWSIIRNSQNNKEVQLKLFQVSLRELKLKASPGTIIIEDKLLFVSASTGWVSIELLQQSGKKRMNTDEFLRGFQNISEWSFI